MPQDRSFSRATPAMPTTRPGTANDEPPPAAREFRGTSGRDRRQHRLAEQAGAQHRRAAGARAIADPRPLQGPQPQRDRAAGPHDGRRVVRIQARAVVVLPHRQAGQSADPVLRPAQDLGRRIPQARHRAARVVQPVPHARPAARRSEPRQPRQRRASRVREEYGNDGLDGPGRAKPRRISRSTSSWTS